MIIGFLEPHLRVCGGIRRILEISNRLLDRGHDVRLYPEETDNSDWFDIRAKVRPFSKVYSDDIDVLIFNLESQYEIPEKTKAKNVVYYILHYGVLYKHPAICRAGYRRWPKRIANSTWTANNVEKDIGLLPGSIPIVGGGINPNHFHTVDIEKEHDVLTMGQPKDWKGHETVVEAMALSGRTCRTYYGLGYAQSEMAEVYSRARVFVVGSWFEGWCQPGIEAMACGVPLVTTDNGGISDYAVDHENALIVPVKDPKAMASAVNEILEDNELRDKLIGNGLSTASNFGWEHITDKFERTLREMVVL